MGTQDRWKVFVLGEGAGEYCTLESYEHAVATCELKIYGEFLLGYWY